MEKRLRMFLAVAVTLMMLMQSVAPAMSVAQDASPEPQTEEVVDTGSEGSGGGEDNPVVPNEPS